MTGSNNKRTVTIGLFIFLGLAILFVTVFTLGGQKKTFVKSFTVHAIFEDVQGLLSGGNVWYAGVKVGTVRKISFSSNSQVEVTMDIDNDAQSFIHKDAKAKIGSDGLIGNKIVVVYGGSENMPSVEKNAYLSVDKAFSTDDMLATFQTNNKNLLDITSEFKQVVKKIDSGNGTLASILNDRSIADKLNSSMDNLQSTIGNFKAVSVNSKAVLLNLQQFSNTLNKPGNSIHDFANDTVMYHKIQQALSQLQSTTNSISQFATNLQVTSNRLNQKNNAIGLLLNDSTAANSLQSTFNNLETSSQKLDEDLEAVQHNFLLRGFFKKREKARISIQKDTTSFKK